MYFGIMLIAVVDWFGVVTLTRNDRARHINSTLEFRFIIQVLQFLRKSVIENKNLNIIHKKLFWWIYNILSIISTFHSK